MKDEIEILIEYLKRNGADVKIDTNPSPDKIERIKKNVLHRENRERALRLLWRKSSL